ALPVSTSLSPPIPGIPAIVHVPLGPRRRRERGFDQALLLAREVARALGARPERLLARVRETAPQARRGAAERRAAMRGAFAATGTVPSAVVLVDDVLTTGATAAACAEALRAAGAREVALLVAARALPRSYTRAGSASGSVVARGIAPR
ncbi:MAG: ComF family protein, partial [Actinomycetota bacterium]